MRENHRRREAPKPAEEIEGQLEGRNALQEALRSGRTIDKVFVAAGDTDRFLQHLAAEAKKAVNIPILCGGRMNAPDLAAQAVAEARTALETEKLALEESRAELKESEAILDAKRAEQLQQLQAENNRMKMQQQQQAKQEQLQQHFGRMQMQAQEMQQTYPGFDLMTELENPTFARLTSPDVGMSLKDAYFAVHHEEIQKASMQYATQQAMMAASQAVQSGTMRPAENGNKPQGPINTSIDPSTWGKKELAQMEKQMRKNGGRVYLG